MNPKLSLVIGIVCISFSPIFVKLTGAMPITSGFYRIFIAWLCLLPYCVAKKQLRIGRQELLIAMIAGVVFAMDIAVWNLSLMKISATVSTLIANLAPVWVGLMGYIFLKKRSGRLFWIGTVVAIAGMVVLVGYQNVIRLQFNIGIPLALLASLLYAIYILVSKGILQKIATLTFMFYSMLAGSVFLLLVNVCMNNQLAGFTGHTWLCFAGMGMLCQVAGWLTISHSLRTLDPGKVSIALLSQTVIACFLAIFILQERLYPEEITGSIIVLVGIAITFIKLKPIGERGEVL
jgi:drug/metabolite transporter (DMT)-like permease